MLWLDFSYLEEDFYYTLDLRTLFSLYAVAQFQLLFNVILAPIMIVGGALSLWMIGTIFFYEVAVLDFDN